MYFNSGTQSIDDYYLKKESINLLIPLNKTCFNEYSIFNEDKLNYYPKWSLNNSFMTNTTDNIKESFEYNNKSNSILIGKYSTYLNGGGYIYKINQFNLNQTLNDLKLLQKLNWINQQTRAIFIELILFNPNVNLFTSCQLIFEFLTTGKIISFINLRSVNLWSTQRQLVITLCYSIYMTVIIIMLTKQLKLLKQSKYKYFKQFWNVINLSLFILSIASIPIYLYKIYSMYDLDKIKSLSNINNLTKWNEILSILMSFCSFLAIIKMIESLKFNSKIHYLSLAIENSSKELISIMIVFIILWLSYVQLMFIVYNEQSFGYSTFIKSMETNFQIILGKFNIKPLIQANFTTGAIIFSSYNIIIVMIMINFIITIISDNFAIAREQSKKIKQLTIFDHMIKRVKLALKREKEQFSEFKDAEKFVENPDYFVMKSNVLINYLNSRITIKKKMKKKIKNVTKNN